MMDRFLERPVTTDDKTTHNKLSHTSVTTAQFEGAFSFFLAVEENRHLTSLSHCERPLRNSIRK
jgi:hypothetical protein